MYLKILNLTTIAGGYFSLKLQIMTTGRAGGLRKRPWGMSQAEPIGSSKETPNSTTFTDMPLKGAFFTCPSSLADP